MLPKGSVEVGAFELTLRDVAVSIGLHLDEVRFRGDSLRIENHPFKLDADKPGKLEAIIKEKSLAALLEAQQPAGLHDFQVQIQSGLITIKAVKTILVDMQATAVCTLRIVEGSKLYVDAQSVDFMGAGARNLVQTQLDKMNPILDAKDLPVEATLDEVVADAGMIVLHGRVYAPKP